MERRKSGETYPGVWSGDISRCQARGHRQVYGQGTDTGVWPGAHTDFRQGTYESVWSGDRGRLTMGQIQVSRQVTDTVVWLGDRYRCLVRGQIQVSGQGADTGVLP